MSRKAALALLLSSLLPVGGSAQQPGAGEPELPRQVAEELVEFFNDPGTIRFVGRSGVPAASAIVGQVAVLGGPFQVEGEVAGDLLVVNGTLELAEGGRVAGDVTVVGGRVVGRDVGEVVGQVVVYPEVLRVVERDGRIALSTRQLRAFARAEGLGRSAFTVRAGTNYNRVEGMPVMFGPILETSAPNPLKVEALGIWRSESGVTLAGDELGYQLLVEQRVDGSPALSLGATLHSTVVPIAQGGLTDLESSLATFILHKDYRDYFERTGWSAFAAAALPDAPLAFRLEYSDEKHRFAPVRSPWTLRRNDDPWRPQPLVAEGNLRTLAGELIVDSRNDRRDPTDGWWIRARTVRGLGGALTTPGHRTDDPLFPPEQVEASPVGTSFTAGVVDARRYARVGPDSDLALRVLLAGSLDGDPIPPQYQHALGGEGTLPGYSLFSLDCGARIRPFVIQREGDDEEEPERVFPRYGCDRATLVQLEFRRRLLFDFPFLPGDDEGWEWYPAVDLSPAWAMFFDLGKGWSRSDPALDTEWVSNLGVGLFFGDVGFYTALPLQREDRRLNFFIRFHRRF